MKTITKAWICGVGAVISAIITTAILAILIANKPLTDDQLALSQLVFIPFALTAGLVLGAAIYFADARRERRDAPALKALQAEMERFYADNPDATVGQSVDHVLGLLDRTGQLNQTPSAG